MPYMVLKDTGAFIEFLKNVFNATEQLVVPNPDGSILHAELRFNEAVIMLASAGTQYQEFPCSLCVPVDDVDAVYQLAIKHGARSIQEPANREYGRGAGFTDPCGNNWWLLNTLMHVA